MSGFQFIDSQDPDAPRKIEKHSALHARLRRRREDRERQQAPRNTGQRLLQPAPPENWQHNDEVRQSALSSGSSKLGETQQSSLQSAESADDEKVSAKTTLVRRRSTNDHQADSPGKRFRAESLLALASMPRPSAGSEVVQPIYHPLSQIDEAGQHVLQWYLLDTATKSFRVGEGSLVNPTRDWLLPCLTHGPLSIQAVLYFGYVYDALAHRGKPTVRMLDHKSKALKSIQKEIQEPDGLSDDLISAVLHMAASERSLGHTKSMHAHNDGVMRIIELRGGLPGLKYNKPLCLLIGYNQISMVSSRVPIKADGSNVTKEERTRHRSFLNFLSVLKEQTGERQVSGYETRIAESMYALYQQRQLISEILKLGRADPRWGPSLSQLTTRCQLACLLYINYMLCLHAHDQQATAAFLDSLLGELTQPLQAGAKLLVLIFLKEMYEEDIDRLWWLVEIMRILYRLRPETRDLLRGVLLQRLFCFKKEHAQALLSELHTLTTMVKTDLRLGGEPAAIHNA